MVKKKKKKKKPPANARDIRETDSIPGLGRSPGGQHGKPLQYSCLKIPWTEEPGRLLSIESCHKESDMTNSHARRAELVPPIWEIPDLIAPEGLGGPSCCQYILLQNHRGMPGAYA